MFFQQQPLADVPESERVTNFRNTSENFKQLRADSEKLPENLSYMLEVMERQTSFSELQLVCERMSFEGNKFMQGVAKRALFMASYVDVTANFGYYLLHFTEELNKHIAKHAPDLVVEAPGL